MKAQPLHPAHPATYGAEDVPYLRNFFPCLAPAHLDHVALLAGMRPPEREPEFTWCDFGCGNGITAAFLAATHPHGRFYGFDLMPEHVAFARRLTADAAIPNATFHVADFTALEFDLPGFDYIVAHGVYSWVRAAARDALAETIDRCLAPGGLVYLSYDAMPGCAIEVPTQRMMKELSATFPGGSVDRMKAAADMMSMMARAGAPFMSDNPVMSRLDPESDNYSPAYVVHAYLTTTWRPFFVTEVRAALAAIGLVPAGSADLMMNYDKYVISHAAREALRAIADEDVRELARDFFVGSRFRRDVFTRPAKTLDRSEQRRRLLERAFALVRPVTAISYEARTPIGRVAFDNEAAREIVAGLAGGPARLADIAANSAVDPQDLLANALLLCATEDLRPVEATKANVSALNNTILRRLGGPDEIRWLALPCGTALPISDPVARWKERSKKT